MGIPDIRTGLPAIKEVQCFIHASHSGVRQMHLLVCVFAQHQPPAIQCRAVCHASLPHSSI